MTFASFNTDGAPSSSPDQKSRLHKARTTLEQWSRDPTGWIVVTGNPGSGKTHLSIAAAQIVADTRKSVAFTTVAELLDRLRRNSFADHQDNTLQELQLAQLLVLDDMGIERTTPFAEEKLYLIINYRYERATPTIITTNLNPEQLCRIRPQTASRMFDYRNTLHIQMESPDYRANLRSN